MVLGLIRALLPGRRKPHVMVDCNWYECSGRLRRWVRKAQLHCVGMSVQRFVVWARHEIADYADEFGLRRDQFTYVPFHGTLDHYDYEIKDEGYLFAGGNYDRDYATLVQAVRGLAVPVWIATTRPLGRAELPDNVRVEGTTPAGFRQAMAAARIVVVPMAPGLLHSGGQQTCLNAMLMGKPTIAVGRKWADDFIQHGVNGLVVDYSDAAGLTTAIRWALNHPAEARAMGQRARLQAQQFSTRRCMQTIYGLVAAGERKP
jgi:glycosyltransferase involved in cell wall biosynthesis